MIWESSMMATIEFIQWWSAAFAVWAAGGIVINAIARRLS